MTKITTVTCIFIDVNHIIRWQENCFMEDGFYNKGRYLMVN